MFVENVHHRQTKNNQTDLGKVDTKLACGVIFVFRFFFVALYVSNA